MPGGSILAEKLNTYTAPVSVLLPTAAISVISAKGQPFHDPAADLALFRAIKDCLRADIPLIELECEINDARFATTCAEQLLANLRSSQATLPTF